MMDYKEVNNIELHDSHIRIYSKENIDYLAWEDYGDEGVTIAATLELAKFIEDTLGYRGDIDGLFNIRVRECDSKWIGKLEAKIVSEKLLDIRMTFVDSDGDEFINYVTYSGAFTIWWA